MSIFVLRDDSEIHIQNISDEDLLEEYKDYLKMSKNSNEFESDLLILKTELMRRRLPVEGYRNNFAIYEKEGDS